MHKITLDEALENRTKGCRKIVGTRGLHITRAEALVLFVLALGGLIEQALVFVFLVLLTAMVFWGIRHIGPKPVLTISDEFLKYEYGKIHSQASWSDVTNCAIHGNRFVGRYIQVFGRVEVSNISNKNVATSRSSLLVADAFNENLEQILEEFRTRISRNN